MNTNEPKKTDPTDDKLDLILKKLDQLLKISESRVVAKDEGPKDPPPTPPNP